MASKKNPSIFSTLQKTPANASAVNGEFTHQIPLDALEDLREAALEAFSALTESADEGAQALCDIYRAQADQVTLSLRLGGRAGVPGPEDSADITRAVLLPLVNQAQVFYDARGCTGVRMTLRVG